MFSNFTFVNVVNICKAGRLLVVVVWGWGAEILIQKRPQWDS